MEQCRDEVAFGVDLFGGSVEHGLEGDSGDTPAKIPGCLQTL